MLNIAMLNGGKGGGGGEGIGSHPGPVLKAHDNTSSPRNLFSRYNNNGRDNLVPGGTHKLYHDISATEQLW